MLSKIIRPIIVCIVVLNSCTIQKGDNFKQLPLYKEKNEQMFDSIYYQIDREIKKNKDVGKQHIVAYMNIKRSDSIKNTHLLSIHIDYCSQISDFKPIGYLLKNNTKIFFRGDSDNFFKKTNVYITESEQCSLLKTGCYMMDNEGKILKYIDCPKLYIDPIVAYEYILKDNKLNKID